MPQVTIALNGRTYRLSCGEGDEARLNDLAAYVNRRIDELSREFGQAGDERLLLMATLLISDELLDTKTRLAQYENPPGEDVLPAEAEPLADDPPAVDGQLARPDAALRDLASPPAETIQPTPARPLIRARARTTLEERLLEARMATLPTKSPS